MDDVHNKDIMGDLLSGADERPSGDLDLDCYIYRTGTAIADGAKVPDLQEKPLSEQDSELMQVHEIEPFVRDNQADRRARKTPRIYVGDMNECTVTIENKIYPLKDISMSGLGVSIETDFVFQLGEFLGDVISGIRIDLLDESFDELEYKIVHISPDTRNNLVCGMVWLNPRPDEVKRLFEVLKKLKKVSRNG